MWFCAVTFIYSFGADHKFERKTLVYCIWCPAPPARTVSCMWVDRAWLALICVKITECKQLFCENTDYGKDGISSVGF